MYIETKTLTIIQLIIHKMPKKSCNNETLSQEKKKKKKRASQMLLMTKSIASYHDPQITFLRTHVISCTMKLTYVYTNKLNEYELMLGELDKSYYELKKLRQQ